MTQDNPTLTLVPLSGGTNTIALAHEQWFSLKEMMVFFLKRWWVFVVAVLLSVILGLSYLRTTPPYYEATMIIAGKDTGSFLSQDSTALMDLLAQSQSSANQKTEQFIDMMLITPVISSIAQKHNLLQRMYGQVWNAETKQWVPPQGTGALIKQRLRHMAGRTPWQEPTLEDLTKLIVAGFSKKQLEKSGFYRLSYRSGDPQFAAFLLRNLFAEANAFQRELELAKNRKRLKYLEDRLNTTKDVFHRREIQAMIRGIENALMIAFVDETIAVDVIDDVSTPIHPAGPRLGKTLAMSIALGLLVASGVVWGWFMLRRR
jgi:uncharacterized protein involved in exopolysaccharide biosynthesis